VPDNVFGKILTASGEAMVLYLARLLDLTFYNVVISSAWKRATVVHIYKGVIDH
jgi:hypothetical protein